jgi:phosphoribosylamine--glycine ligase
VNILLIGSGGREHALAWKIAASPLLSSLFVSPGNPGTAQFGENIPLAVGDHAEVITFCRNKSIGLVVVGPEQPLVDGLADALIQAGIPVFGPRKMAALLEGSKSYAKEIMLEAGVPTAAYKNFTSIDDAVSYCRSEATVPVVVKLDGLAAGKGVFICQSREEAVYHLEQVRSDTSLAGASASIVVESYMEGEEVSVFAICDGKDHVLLTPVQDHKRIGDNDTGLNTGGMGAYGPAPVIDADGLAYVSRAVVTPMLRAMERRGCPYVGVLYCGMMMTPEGPKVVEFNCRFGDPECEVLMPLLHSDVVSLMLAATEARIAQEPLQLSTGSCCTVVLAAEGYPATPAKGDAIYLPQHHEPDTWIFHAGTKMDAQTLVTSGGRVLNCVGRAENLQLAIEKAYRLAGSISFRGKYARTDIGKKGLARLDA